MVENGLTVIKANEPLHGLQTNIIHNRNISSNELNKVGLHLNPSEYQSLLSTLLELRSLQRLEGLPVVFIRLQVLIRSQILGPLPI